MRKIIFVILTFSVLTGCSLIKKANNAQIEQDNAPVETVTGAFEVHIRQNNKIINETGNIHRITDNKFEILVTNEKNNIISIFAYHNDEMFNKYTFPRKCEDTVIFHPATAIINSADENREITLTVNREMQFNVITHEKSTNENGISVIKIKDIADTDDKFNGVLFLTVFIDLNNNKIIENNEVKNMSVAIHRAQNSNLFRAKIHVSTMGGWIRDINYPVYGNEYFYVKISNETEKERFFELFGRQYGNNTYSSINRVRDLDYSKNNMYIIFSPITTEIEFYNNPYRYAGENRLIFDTRINSASNRGRYVFYREYRVEKRNDLYEIWINVNGTIRRINELLLR